MQFKTCKNCNKVKEASAFGSSGHGTLHSQCKLCRKTIFRLRYNSDPTFREGHNSKRRVQKGKDAVTSP